MLITLLRAALCRYSPQVGCVTILVRGSYTFETSQVWVPEVCPFRVAVSHHGHESQHGIIFRLGLLFSLSLSHHASRFDSILLYSVYTTCIRAVRPRPHLAT